MVRDRKQNHRKTVLRAVFISMVVVCVGILCSLFCFSKVQKGRLAVVLQGSPTMLVSWESERPRFTVFLLSESLQMEAGYGYGWYALDALWKLDTMDQMKGRLYRTSVEEALATPIRWHMETYNGTLSTPGDGIGVLKDTFSFVHLLSLILQGETNIRVWELVYLWKQFQLLGSDTATVFDFRNNQIAQEELQPDQTVVSRFDKEKYDVLIGNSLEDTKLRQEGVRIALYNTTGIPGIGQRVARFIEHIGGYVVSVGNDEVPYDGTCEVIGSSSALSSRTALFFRTMYDCVLQEQLEETRADLVVRLGRGLGNRYQAVK